MKSRELRALARESLQGKWGKGAILSVVYLIVTIIISYILAIIPIIGQITSLLISPVLSFGIMVSFVKLGRNEAPTCLEFLTGGFHSFAKVWGVTLQTLLKMLLPVILVIVGAILISTGILDSEGILFIGIIVYFVGLIYTIIKSFSYSLTLFILHDEPELTSKEIVEKSESLMQGNKWRYFCLSFSFIGWLFLSLLTFGIAYLWILPYVQVSNLKFYEELAGLTTAESATDNLS